MIYEQNCYNLIEINIKNIPNRFEIYDFLNCINQIL